MWTSQEGILEWDTARGNILFYDDVLSVVQKRHWAASSLNTDMQLVLFMFPCSGRKEEGEYQITEGYKSGVQFLSKSNLGVRKCRIFKKAQIVSFTEWLPGWLEISGDVFTVKQSVGENAERVDGTEETAEFSLILFPLLPRSRSFQVNTKQENNQIQGSLHWL